MLRSIPAFQDSEWDTCGQAAAAIFYPLVRSSTGRAELEELAVFLDELAAADIINVKLPLMQAAAEQAVALIGSGSEAGRGGAVRR
jgi:hypothetical protein